MQHSFDVEVAVEYGVNAAILLQNIYFWCEHNRANEKNYIDGLHWTFNSGKAFHDLFPYMSEKQIRTALKKLEDENLVVTGNHNTATYDRTKWYAVTQKGKSILQKGKMEDAKRENGIIQNVTPIPDINTDNKPDINTDVYSVTQKGKKVKRVYGDYSHVRLTDEEYVKLKREYGENNTKDYIKFLDEYIEEKKYKSNSNYIAIRRWVVDAVNEKRLKQKKGKIDWDAL